MSHQLPLPALPYPALPPLAVDAEAMEQFELEFERRLAEFDRRFYVPRKHPKIEVRRHSGQPVRKPR